MWQRPRKPFTKENHWSFTLWWWSVFPLLSFQTRRGTGTCIEFMPGSIPSNRLKHLMKQRPIVLVWNSPLILRLSIKSNKHSWPWQRWWPESMPSIYPIQCAILIEKSMVLLEWAVYGLCAAEWMCVSLALACRMPPRLLFLTAPVQT